VNINLGNRSPHIGSTAMNNENIKKEILVKNRSGFWKVAILIGLFVILCAGSATVTYYLFARNITKEKEQQVQIIFQEKEKISNMNKSLEEKLDKLSADYEKIYKDRENIIEQSRRIIQEKNALLNVKADFEKITAEKEKLLKEKEELTQQLDSIIKETKQAQNKYEQELTSAKRQIRTYQDEITEKNKINEELINKTGIRKLEASIQALESDNKALDKQLKEISIERDNSNKQLELNKKEYEKEKLTLQNRYNNLNKKYIDLTKKYQKLVQEQRLLNKKLAEFPSKIVSLANENKKLIKETADMHFNLGLFYFGAQEYKRALPEFERGIKINPQDAEAYYHAGYIYAEHLMNRNKAIEYFNKYLQLSPRGTHSAWVEQYILSWRIWDNKENIE